jgi:hypothetical protein
MQRTLASLGALMALAACSDVRQPTAPVVGGPAFAASSSNHDAKTNTRTPFTSILLSPCTGETVRVTGILHTVTKTDADHDGGERTKTHTNFEDVTAVALGSGRRYRVVSTTNTSVTTWEDGSTVTRSVVNFLVISQGPLDNWVVHIRSRVRVDPDGNATQEVNDVRAECRG